ncbi:acyclic terpene utilization AtuA family protein [Haloglomus litoreum]|uniref:acyclic terpene utilization AtuA family protein n=1 Tax=Haloglomus litoreum TaxID=3034026 RepID=UPI0023E7CA45|nr:acyclic terpene utilization AtuA family protein [Haloglomus sp. DT116]
MIRIGYPSGFWGDDPGGPAQIIDREPDVDYLAMDYLAEVTMAILKRQQTEDASLGYARDFPAMVGRILPDLVEQDIGLVANAGGVNPTACQESVLEVAADAGFDVAVAAVTGDDILSQVPAFRDRGVDFDNMDTGAPFEEIADDLIAANAYLGAFPIAEALEQGADIVVTGRCVDAATVLGPLVHEYGWTENDLDRLSSGVIAGHILECGAQATGGNFLGGWQDVDFTDIGFPIVEMAPDGEFVVTKPEGTGGMVTEATVKEQLVYEITDPRSYVVPDVTADFTSLQLAQAGADRVRVSGCRGRSPPEDLKVTALYQDGYKAQVLFTYSWPDALEKARRADEIVRERLERAAVDLDEIHTEFLGYDGCHGAIAPEPVDPNEITLRIVARASEKAPLHEFGQQAIPIALGGPPNVTAVVDGRPKPTEILSFWPCTVPRELVDVDVSVASSGGTA